MMCCFTCEDCGEVRADSEAKWCPCGSVVCAWCGDDWTTDTDGEAMCPGCAEKDREQAAHWSARGWEPR